MRTAGRRIYVVDDDDSVCRAISRLLKIAGFSPECFSRGEDFLNRSSFEAGACVVCDIRMPGLDGVEVWNSLRDRKIELPFIFMTAVHDEATVQEAKRIATAVFWKPVDGEELIKTLETMCD